MATLATLQQYRERLLAARASGELETVHSDGRKIRYRSVAELDRAIAANDDEIAFLTNASKPSSTLAALGDRG